MEPIVGEGDERDYPANFNPEGWHTCTCYWKNEAYKETLTYLLIRQYITSITTIVFQMG